MTPKEAWDAAYKRSAREVSGTSAEVFKSRELRRSSMTPS